MPIKDADKGEWAGASSRIVPPIGAEDCTKFPTFVELVKEEAKAGRGVTIRKGIGFAKRTVGQIETACTPLVPTISDVQPNPMLEGWTAVVSGANFEGQGGHVWLSDADTWGEEIVKEEQPTSAWSSVEIAISVVHWVVRPANVWLYVEDKYGLVNPAGYAVAIWDPL